MIMVWETALIAGVSAFLLALVVGVISTSMMCRISWRFGAIDRPDGSLKRHHREVATLGGIPLFIAILAGVSVLLILNYGISKDSNLQGFGWDWSWAGLLLAGLVVMVVGACDDLYRVMPRTKFLSQLLAAAILVGSGILIRRCDFFEVFLWCSDFSHMKSKMFVNFNGFS